MADGLMFVLMTQSLALAKAIAGVCSLVLKISLDASGIAAARRSGTGSRR